MTERFTEIDQFEGGSIRDALAAEIQPTRDIAFGQGSVLSVASGKALLEVFPDAAVARVTTGQARVELHHIPGYAVDDDKSRVIFEQGTQDDRTRLIVRDDGKVSFHPVLRAPDAAVAPESRPSGSQAAETTSPTPDATTAPVKTTPEVSQEAGETVLVTLQGRLGRDPWFSGGQDSPIAGFPLAVNEANQTTWHKVVAFDEAARALEDQAKRGDIRKGRLVDVTGQTVIREEVTTRGTKKTREFHATRIARVKSTRSR
jgi:hypothetical protein